jgi:hypothetical protein
MVFSDDEYEESGKKVAKMKFSSLVPVFKKP